LSSNPILSIQLLPERQAPEIENDLSEDGQMTLW
jgi:hypothetical protein